MSIVYRPLHDLIWLHERRSRLQWEDCAIGESILCFAPTPMSVKEMIFKASVSRGLDWTWEIERTARFDNGKHSHAWMCKRIA
jgi:hypothetical protein